MEGCLRRGSLYVGQAAQHNQEFAAKPVSQHCPTPKSLCVLRGGFSVLDSEEEGRGPFVHHIQDKGNGNFFLITPGHDHLSYYGIMFDIKALNTAVLITGLQMCTTAIHGGPYLYKVYTTDRSCSEVKEVMDSWVEVGAGETSLPYSRNTNLTCTFHGHRCPQFTWQLSQLQDGRIFSGSTQKSDQNCCREQGWDLCTQFTVRRGYSISQWQTIR